MKPTYHCRCCRASRLLLRSVVTFVVVFLVALAVKAEEPRCTDVGVRAEFSSVPTLAQWLDVVGLPRARVERPYGVVLSPERAECVDELVLGLRAALTDCKDLNVKQDGEIALVNQKYQTEHVARVTAEVKASMPKGWRTATIVIGSIVGGYVLATEPWKDW